MSSPEEVSTRTRWVIPLINTVATVGVVLLGDYWLWGLVWVASALALLMIGFAGFTAWKMSKARRPG